MWSFLGYTEKVVYLKKKGIFKTCNCHLLIGAVLKLKCLPQTKILASVVGIILLFNLGKRVMKEVVLMLCFYC